MSDPALLYLSGNGTTAGTSAAGAVNATQNGTERFTDGYAGGTQAFLIEEATTNLVTNPSLEVDASGWSADGTSTIVRSPDRAEVGSASALCTRNDHSNVAVRSLTVPSAGTYALAASVYIPSATTVTGDVLIRLGGFTGSGTVSTSNANTSARDQWQRVSSVVTIDAGDLSGFLIVVAGLATGGTIYMDAGQVEQKDHATSYTDGSLGTGYAWTSTPHASTSTRAASTLTIPLSGAWGSVAFRYKESGAWQEGYLTAAGAIGTYGALAHDGSEFTISTTRQLTIGPFMAFDRELTGTERDQLFGRNNWSLDVFSRITPNGLFLPL